MALNIIQKAFSRMKFLYRNAKFLNSNVKKLLFKVILIMDALTGFQLCHIN